MGIRISAINMIARPFLAVIYHLLISISRSSEASQISSSQFITKEVLLQFRYDASLRAMIFYDLEGHFNKVQKIAWL
jgi:hypothetical protein